MARSRENTRLRLVFSPTLALLLYSTASCVLSFATEQSKVKASLFVKYCLWSSNDIILVAHTISITTLTVTGNLLFLKLYLGVCVAIWLQIRPGTFSPVSSYKKSKGSLLYKTNCRHICYKILTIFRRLNHILLPNLAAKPGFAMVETGSKDSPSFSSSLQNNLWPLSCSVTWKIPRLSPSN